MWKAGYLMVDETTELVGVEAEEGKVYKKKYLWAFFAKHIRMVYYHYNNGSRASDVAKSFLECPPTDIRSTGCSTAKNPKCSISAAGRTAAGCGWTPFLPTAAPWKSSNLSAVFSRMKSCSVP